MESPVTIENPMKFETRHLVSYNQMDFKRAAHDDGKAFSARPLRFLARC